MRKTTVAGAVAALMLVGCANLHDDYTPKMETSGRDPVQVADDISECQAIAYHRKNSSGLFAGAVAGLATGGIVGGPAAATVLGTGAGVALGPGSGYEFSRSRVQITRDCLENRGYKLLD